MILQQQKNEAQYIGDIQENKVGIDAKNIDFITTLLTSNLYSKPFASFLRETISNACDSHTEAGTKRPIILLFEDGDGYNQMRVSVRDYGTGISPERFDKIYRFIGSSTKRESNDFIGAFGIGKYSCLSCADVANVTSYYDGTKYSYLMYKNNGGINIDRLSAEKGDFKNGLEISINMRIPTNDEFEEAIKLLYLFDNLHIENKATNFNYRICNAIRDFNGRKVVYGQDYHIINEQNFGIRYSENYIGLGKVIYPVIGYIHTRGIIINLPIGSVDVTPNRETLQFTERTKAVIEAKVKKIKEDWGKDVSNTMQNTDLPSFFAVATKNYVTLSSGLKVDKDDIKLDVSIVKIDGMPIPENYDQFLERFSYISIPSATVYKNIYATKTRRNLVFGDLLRGTFKAALKLDDITKSTTISYFRTTVGECIVFNRKTVAELTPFLATLTKDSFWNNKGLDISKCIEFTFNHLSLLHLSNAAVPESYIKEIRLAEKLKKQKLSDMKTEIIRVFDRYQYRQFDFEMFMSSNLKYAPFVIYGPNSRDENKLYQYLANLFNDYYRDKRYMHPLVITAKTNVIATLKDRKKFVNVTDFLYLRNNFWSKLLTAEVIYQKLRIVSEKQWNLPILREFRKKYELQLRCLSSLRDLPIYDDIKQLYIDNNWLNSYDISYFSLSEVELNMVNGLTELMAVDEDVIRAVMFRKFGKNDKLGINKPKSFIYKYIK